MDITFSVDNQIISRTDNNAVVSGSKNFLRAVFTLSPTWRTDHTITPVFRVGDKPYTPEMHEGRFLDEKNSCIVPHEVLSSAGIFYVSIFDETDNVRITANESPVRVIQSGYNTAEPSLTPTPTVYDEILRSYGDLNEKINGLQFPNGLQLNGNTLHLTVDSTPIGNGAKLPNPPDDLRVVDNVLQLTCNGTTVGTGACLPIPAPWAKQITYSRAAMGDKMSVGVSKINQSCVALLTVTLSCAKYTRTDTEITSVTPILSDYRGVTITANANDDYRTAASLHSTVTDIAEEFIVNIDGETLSLSFAELEYTAKNSGAVDVIRSIQCMTESDTSYSDGVCKLLYMYSFRFPDGDTELMHAFCDEVLSSIVHDGLTDFTVQYSDISYIKSAEVTDNE